MQTHPRKAIHHLITAHACSINMYMCISCVSCKPHPVEVFRSSRITSIYDTDPTQAIKHLDDTNPVNFLQSATLSFEQYSSPCLLQGRRQDMREHRRRDYYSSLLAVNHSSPTTQFTPRSFLLNIKCARVLHASPFATCDTPRIPCHPHPEGEPCNTVRYPSIT